MLPLSARAIAALTEDVHKHTSHILAVLPQSSSIKIILAFWVHDRRCSDFLHAIIIRPIHYEQEMGRLSRESRHSSLLSIAFDRSYGKVTGGRMCTISKLLWRTRASLLMWMTNAGGNLAPPLLTASSASRQLSKACKQPKVYTFGLICPKFQCAYTSAGEEEGQ